MESKNNLKGYIFAFIVVILWGFLPIALKVATNVLTPIEIVWARFSIAFIGLVIYNVLTNKNNIYILFKPPILLIISGIFLLINYYGFMLGIHLAGPSVSQIFIQLGPIFLAVTGFIFFKEPITHRKIVGLIMVFVGLFIFYKENLTHLVTGISIFNKGIISLIIGAFSWTIYSFLQKIIVKKISPIQANIIIFLIPTLFLLPIININNFINLSLPYLLLLLFLGLNTLISYISLSLALKYAEANKVSVIIILNPILTFLTMYILSKIKVTWISPEHYTIMTITGAAIVITGAILTIMSNKR